jgi:hypothetical protein
MLRVVSHDRPIALANTSSDCELVSRVSYSIAAVGRFDIARRRWATAAAPRHMFWTGMLYRRQYRWGMDQCKRD